MKLETAPNPVTSNMDTSKQLHMEIGDEVMVIGMLRAQYSNPVKSITREIISNGIDSHVQAIEEGLLPEMLPVEVKFTAMHEMDQEVRFIDHGVGIDDERIDLMRKLGVSTKRSTNNQNGAFGLGFKSPFSDVDTFYVRSVKNEVYNEWMFYLDESRRGALLKLEEREVIGEPNRTEIAIPLRDVDHRIEYDRQVRQFIHFHPRGSEAVRLYSTSVDTEGNVCYALADVRSNYILTATSGAWSLQQDHQSEGNITVGGIAYPSTSVNLLPKGVTLHLNIGDVDLIPNRENMEETLKTRTAIQSAVGKYYRELNEIAAHIADGLKWEAPSTQGLPRPDLFIIAEIKKVSAGSPILTTAVQEMLAERHEVDLTKGDSDQHIQLRCYDSRRDVLKLIYHWVGAKLPEPLAYCPAGVSAAAYARWMWKEKGIAIHITDQKHCGHTLVVEKIQRQPSVRNKAWRIGYTTDGRPKVVGQNTGTGTGNGTMTVPSERFWCVMSKEDFDRGICRVPKKLHPQILIVKHLGPWVKAGAPTVDEILAKQLKREEPNKGWFRFPAQVRRVIRNVPTIRHLNRCEIHKLCPLLPEYEMMISKLEIARYIRWKVKPITIHIP